MNRVFLSGDSHGDFTRFSSKHFHESKKLTKDDYVIILGDFGLLWTTYISDKEKYWLKWLNEKPFTTLFIDGNHENFYRLNKLPTIEKFGDEVGVVSDNIFHLKRGRVYTIGNKTFFTMGGACSIDKQWRKEGKTWWPEEMPNEEEYETGRKNLKLHNHKVDYILSHTCSNREFNVLREHYFVDDRIDNNKDEYPLRDYLEWVLMTTKYKHHYFGHFHANGLFDKFTVMYYLIEELK